MSEEEKVPTISIDDFMNLSDAEESTRKAFSNEDYLGQLSSKEARNAAVIASALEVTPATVERRLKKLQDNVLVRFDGTEAFYVLKPAPKKGKGKGKGVEL